jgi:hypothetical protein
VKDSDTPAGYKHISLKFAEEQLAVMATGVSERDAYKQVQASWDKQRQLNKVAEKVQAQQSIENDGWVPGKSVLDIWAEMQNSNPQ